MDVGDETTSRQPSIIDDAVCSLSSSERAVYAGTSSNWAVPEGSNCKAD